MLSGQVAVFELEIEQVHFFSDWFIFFKMQVRQVWMFQGIFGRDSLLGIELKKSLEEINCLRRSEAKQFGEVFAILFVL